MGHRTFGGDDDDGGGTGGGPTLSNASPLAVGPTLPGTSNQASRADHRHPILTVATSAAMTALVVTTMPDGTPVYVASRDRVFRLQTSAFTVNTWDVFASATAGRQWLAEDSTSLISARVTAWTINTTTGDDDAIGTGASPLRTLNELSMRLNNAWLIAAVTVTVTGNVPATDVPFFTFRCAPAATVTFIGVPTVIFTSTFTGVVIAAAGPSITENTVTDAAVPGGSFTASGAMADGVIGERTVGGAVAQFWFAKDNGATTARVSKATTALANGNTYTASTLPTMATAMRFLEQRYNAVVFRKWRVTSGPWTDSSLRFEQCWFNSSVTLPSVTFSNCAFTGGTIINQGSCTRALLITVNGMVRGTGANSLQMVLGANKGLIGTNTSITFQAAFMSVEQGMLSILSDQYFNDFTGAGLGCLTAINGAKILWETGALVGSGNTTYLARARRGSSVAFVTNPVFVAGSSTNATPISNDGSPDFSVANLANDFGTINASSNAIFNTDTARAALLWPSGVSAPGAVLVTMNNAPAGSPAAPARYVTIPDGVGGVYTIPSLT